MNQGTSVQIRFLTPTLMSTKPIVTIYPGNGLNHLLDVNTSKMNGHQLMELAKHENVYLGHLNKLLSDCKSLGYKNPRITLQEGCTRLEVDQEKRYDGWPRFWYALWASPIYSGCAGAHTGQIDPLSVIFGQGRQYKPNYSRNIRPSELLDFQYAINLAKKERRALAKEAKEKSLQEL